MILKGKSASNFINQHENGEKISLQELERVKANYHLLKLQWDELTSQYKVDKPNDQSGLYVNKEFADKLKEDNALLIEALEKCIVQFEGIVGYGNRDDEAAINKAKELLNKHKNDKHENKTIG